MGFSMKVVDRLGTFCLAAVFLLAGLDKIAHYSGFVNALRDYQLVIRGAAPWLASPLIALELMIGVGLLVQAWRRVAALTAVVTLVLFTLALTVNYIYGGRGICGCWFTLTLARGNTQHIALNVVLAALAVLIAYDRNSRRPARRGPLSGVQ
jgi:putative oxidoreductase